LDQQEEGVDDLEEMMVVIQVKAELSWPFEPE
jgi:hypothetical protein